MSNTGERLKEIYGNRVDNFTVRELVLEMQACANREREGNADHAAYLLDLGAARVLDLYEALAAYRSAVRSGESESPELQALGNSALKSRY